MKSESVDVWFLDQSSLIADSIILPIFSTFCSLEWPFCGSDLGFSNAYFKRLNTSPFFFRKGRSTEVRPIKFLIQDFRPFALIPDIHQFNHSPRWFLLGTGLRECPEAVISKWPLDSIKIMLTQQHWAMQAIIILRPFHPALLHVKSSLNDDLLKNL